MGGKDLSATQIAGKKSLISRMEGTGNQKSGQAGLAGNSDRGRPGAGIVKHSQPGNRLNAGTCSVRTNNDLASESFKVRGLSVSAEWVEWA